MARQRTTTGSGKKGTRAPARGKATKAPARTRRAAPDGGVPSTMPAALGVETRSRFVLYNLLGEERTFYQVDRAEIEKPPPPKTPTLAHSVLIIDRSGSMTPYIEDLKDTLLKLLTLDEYSQFDLLVTLISYSSEGDCQVHFQRRPIQEIMKRDSKEAREIRKIEATGSTCISQALRLAAELCRDRELTCVTLHSDGFANDPSPAQEAKTIEELCSDMQKRPIFVNTIAYTDFSDFRLLSKVANSVSGSCLKAGNIKQVYDALYNTEKLLASSVTPPLEMPLEKGYDYQVFVSHSGGKVNGAADTLRVRGLKDEDDAVLYRYKELTEAQYRKMKDVPEVQTGEAVMAFARARLAEGAVNTAKYALASTYDATLFERHGKALTNLQVAAMAQDLDTVLFQPGILQEHEILDQAPVNRRISVLELAALLDRHRDVFVVNLEHLKGNYSRRGLRRVQGTRDDEGNLVEPALKTQFTDAGDYSRVDSFDINHNTANLNMLIARPVRLLPRGGGEPIAEVAGIKLDGLKVFNNYTIVGDGELNVMDLRVKLSSRELFDRLKKENVIEFQERPATTYDAEAEYTIRMDNLPLVPPFRGAVDLDGVFDDLAEVKTLSSILAAHLKEESDRYTPEQLAELKKHYLSKNLYVNFPTVTEYTDLQQALAEGTVDSRVSYKIDVGNHHILNLGKLMPANRFLDRMYEVRGTDGEKIDKPTFEEFLDGGVTVKHKKLTARTKVTPADKLMKRVFDSFLGLADEGVVDGILERAGADDLRKLLARKREGTDVPRGEYVAALTDALRRLDRHADDVYHERVSPLVFYIGSTGVLPDEMDTKALAADELTKKYPDLALSKDERDGMFFEVGEAILSVYARTEYFSR